MSKMLKSALWYAEMRGWAVIPLHWVENGQCSCHKGAECTSPAKHPIIPNGVKGASRDTDQVKRWWEQYPKSNIGIVTGFENGIFVLDVDGEEGQHSLDDLIYEYGELPHTLEVLTGSGGKHIYFKYQDGIKNKVGFKPKLDIRSTDGFVVAPPSKHISGGVYEWELSSTPDNLLAEAPEWLMQMIKTPKVLEHQKKPKSHWDSIIHGVNEGVRNESATSLSGLLIRRFFDNLELAWELLLAWNDRNNPPIEEEELLTTFRSVLNKEIQRRKGA